MLRLKRVYDQPKRSDGMRILVDRLWPRGLTKAKARVDLWLKEVAPSPALRKWFNHEPKKWPGFKKKYAAELKKKPMQIKLLKTLIKYGPVTLVYGSRDEVYNDAVALKAFLRK